MADLITSQVFSDGEKGITATKLNNIVALSQIQTAFFNAKPTTSTLDPTDMLLTLKSSGSYAQVSGANLSASVSSGTYGISRLRSYNAIGNPNFEVDQRNAGTGIVNVANGAFVQDRWKMTKVGTMTVNSLLTGTGAGAVVPGTNYRISSYYQSITLTGQEVSLAAGDFLAIQQVIEGSAARALVNDVSSISLLVTTNATLPLKFGLTIRDSNSAYSLTKLCTITAAGWNLIQLPNLPTFTTSGTFNTTPGTFGYQLSIVLASGTTFMSPANDIWQTGNFLGAVGQDNFAAKPVNTNFQILFVQHEPGANCTTLMDKPFSQNLDECLRYYQKTYNYATVPATLTTTGALAVNASAGALSVAAPLRFYKPMARTATIVGYSPNSATVNQVRDFVASTDRVISGALMTGGDSGFGGWNITTSNASATYYVFHYTADSQW